MFYAKIDYYLLKKCGVNDINFDRTGTLKVTCVVKATFLRILSLFLLAAVNTYSVINRSFAISLK